MAPEFRDLVSDLAVRYGMTIIAGSHPVQQGKQIYNACFICLPDGSIVEQRKLHITPSERKWWGITGGTALHVSETPKAKIGGLICSGVEFPEAARLLADNGGELLFVPLRPDHRR